MEETTLETIRWNNTDITAKKGQKKQTEKSEEEAPLNYKPPESEW